MAPPRTPPIRWWALTAVLVFLHLMQPSFSIYCDEDDCYDLLGVSQTANASEIKKAYYKLSLKYHPDKNPDPESKKLFVKIANAYEILKDDATREQYDYAIAHPEEVFYNTARYYRAYYGHKTDPRAVLVGLLLVLSAFQYLNQWTRYKQALDMVKKTPAYKNKLKALELERTGGLTSRKKSNKQTNKKLEEELSKELELQIKGAEKPSVWALLGIRFILLPYTFGKILLWYGGWFWRYKVKQASYAWEDASYLTRRSLGVPSDSWQYVVTDPVLGKSEEDQHVLAIPQKENYGSKEPNESSKEDLIQKRLWEKSNLEHYLAEMRKESKRRR